MSSPRYAQIAEQLQQAIHRGDYPVGSQLPTEKVLCKVFSISRYTARAALQELQQRGIISRRQGSGSTVQAAQPSIKYNQFVESIEDLLDYGNNTQFKITRTEHIQTDHYLASLLECSIGDDCVALHGLRFDPNSDKPFCISEVYRLPHSNPLDQLYEDHNQAIYALIDELRLDHIGKVEQNITAVNLNVEQARELNLDPGTAALKMVRRYLSPKGHTLVLAISTHPGCYFTYTNTFAREPG
jgi:DNA-binding GntR family transcriptional regulator